MHRAFLQWILKQATRGVLGQIIKSVLESLGVWQFVVAVPIAVSVGVKAMMEGSQAVSFALMLGVTAAVVVLLHYVALSYERIRETYFGGGFAVERRQIAETEIATLTADEKAAIRQMLVVGRPKDLSDQIWRSLENKTSFVERDFTGPKGIKNEFRSVLEEILNKKNETTIISALQMTVGESGPYFSTEGGVYDIRRTFNLKLENTNRSKSLSDCSIRIMEVVPPTDYEGPWLLKDGITLAAGDYVFIPLVTYGEAREPDKYACGDTFITMGTANGRPCLDIGEEYTVTLRATAPETAFCEFQCKVWVAADGRLRIAELKSEITTRNELKREDDWTPAVDAIEQIIDHYGWEHGNGDSEEAAEMKLRDAASLGGVSCRGRPRIKGLESFLGTQRAKRPIPIEHFRDENAEFDLTRMYSSDVKNSTYIAGYSGDAFEKLTVYDCVEVNKDEVCHLWPVANI